MAPFRYLPHVFFVAKYGLEHFEPAMRAQYELTKRFSAEYSIRGFLERVPGCDAMSGYGTGPPIPTCMCAGWSREGTRPRLPWAPRLRAFQNDPDPVSRCSSC